ncbi:MAG: FGGY family carbohydrate kinase [Actinomycetota bacterium]|nr:FGGY family carbohydrate kinase [Actinomycetota bacterium]
MHGQVMGVWFGPRATLAEVRDVDTGELIAAGHAQHAEFGPPADALTWWRSVSTAMARTGIGTVDALSVAGGHPGLVLVDGAGAVLRPMQPWGATSGTAERLRQALGAERWARRAGLVPEADSTVTRLAWLRRAEPASFARIGLVLAPHEWLTYRLSGRPVTDQGSASQSGLWSPHTGRWIPDVLELLAPHDTATWARRLPQVVGATERADWLAAPVFEMLGLHSRPLVAPGTGEAMAVSLALGLGVGQAGIGLTEHTTALLPVATPIVDASGVVRSRAGADDGHLAVTWEPGGATLLSTVADLLDLPPAELGHLARSAAAPDPSVVIVPGSDPDHRAVLTGLGHRSTRGAVARAAFDGIACAAASALDELAGAGAAWHDDEPLHLTGPAPFLEVQGRLLADVVGRPVVLSPGSLAAAGAAIQAAAVLHETDPTDVAAAWAMGDGTWVDPRPDASVDDRRAAYAAARARHDQGSLIDD